MTRATRSSPTDTYRYYFEQRRPAFVTRLLRRKHASLLHLATRDSTTIRSLLEVGVGEGFIAEAATAASLRYAGVESSRVGADRVRARGFQVEHATVPPFPAGTGPVDAIYASHVIEHLRGPAEVALLLEEARELLRPGGRVALVFPDARWMGIDFWDCDYTHQWPSTPRRVRQVAWDSGYSVTATYHCCLHLHGAAAFPLRLVYRLIPATSLGALDRRREDLWYRGKILFAPDVLMVLEPT